MAYRPPNMYRHRNRLFLEVLASSTSVRVWLPLTMGESLTKAPGSAGHGFVDA